MADERRQSQIRSSKPFGCALRRYGEAVTSSSISYIAVVPALSLATLHPVTRPVSTLKGRFAGSVAPPATDVADADALASRTGSPHAIPSARDAV